MRPRVPLIDSHTRAVLIGQQRAGQRDDDAQASLAELGRLVSGLGARILHSIPPRRTTALLGEGKREELVALLPAQRDGIVVVVDAAPTPSLLRQLEAAVDVPVLDRPGVILAVIGARARTRVAQLEVELAWLAYELPRVRDDETLGDREGGGGRASRGHSNVELAKQRLRAPMAALRRELDGHRAAHEAQRVRRRSASMVALVGYTNAGKSSLMRALTGTDAPVDDRPFTTLGTTVRALAPAVAPPVLVTDTVGFVRDLPHELVASFRSTLDEAHDAGLLLHVVDASDPGWRGQLRVTHDTLAAIGAGDVPARLILNKIDRVAADVRDTLAREHPEALLLSAHDPGDIRRLWATIAGFFDDAMVEEVLDIPFAQGHLLGAIRAGARVIAEAHDEGGTALTIRAPAASLAAWQAALPPPRPLETVDDVLALARRHGLDTTAISPELDGSGLDFRVVHARDGEGQRWILRTPRRPDVALAARREARVLRLVRARLPVAVPDWRVHGERLIAYPRLDGIPAISLDDPTAPVWNLDPAAPSDAFLDSFADALVALQALPIEEASAAGVPTVAIDEDRAALARDMDATREALAPSEAVWARWQRWLADHGSWPQHLALVHADLHPGHMLLGADGRLTGILDWTEAKITDPSMDLAMFHGCFGRAALEALVARLVARGAATWPRLVDHAAERWAAFPVIGAAWALRTGNEAVLAHARGHLASVSGGGDTTAP